MYNGDMNPYQPPPSEDPPDRSFGERIENLLRGMAITFAFLAMVAICLVIFIGSPLAMLTGFGLLFGLVVVGMLRARMAPDSRRPGPRREWANGDNDALPPRPVGRRFPRS